MGNSTKEILFIVICVTKKKVLSPPAGQPSVQRGRPHVLLILHTVILWPPALPRGEQHELQSPLLQPGGGDGRSP